MDYLCIDLKSFYASVECVERGLDPLRTMLVVADNTRGKGTICLAVSPFMKKQGVRNRCRLFEIPDYMNYIIAKPRMKKYMEYSALIYSIYLKYIAKEDMHVYSIDEVFLDVTHYLKLYNKTPYMLGKMIIQDIFDKTGITATCGVGTNMFLSKVALDVLAKSATDGIATLDEEKFKKELWNYTPLTDFWQIGTGISKRLNKLGLYNLSDVAKVPEDVLYKEFGVNAKFLIDHANGKEEATIKDIKEYIPKAKSLSSGQVLDRDYHWNEARLVTKEMVELLSLDLVSKRLVTNHVALNIGYSSSSYKDVDNSSISRKLDVITNSFEILTSNVLKLFDEIINKEKDVRKISISFGGLKDDSFEKYDLFTDIDKVKKEKKVQETILEIKDKFGKSSIIRGMNLDESATTLKRNKLIGGHNGE